MRAFWFSVVYLFTFFVAHGVMPVQFVCIDVPVIVLCLLHFEFWKITVALDVLSYFLSINYILKKCYLDWINFESQFAYWCIFVHTVLHFILQSRIVAFLPSLLPIGQQNLDCPPPIGQQGPHSPHLIGWLSLREALIGPKLGWASLVVVFPFSGPFSRLGLL